MTLLKERRHRLRAWRAPWLGLRSVREGRVDGNAWPQERARTTSPPQPFVPDCQSAWLVVDWSIRRPEPIPSRPRLPLVPRKPPSLLLPVLPARPQQATPQPSLSPDSRHGPRPPALTTRSSPRPLAILPLPTISTFHSHPDDLPTPSPATSTSAPSFLLRSNRLDDWKRRRVLRRLRPVKRRTARKSRCETSAWELIERGFFGNPTTNTRHFSSRLTTVDRTPNPESIHEDDDNTHHPPCPIDRALQSRHTQL